VKGYAVKTTDAQRGESVIVLGGWSNRRHAVVKCRRMVLRMAEEPDPQDKQESFWDQRVGYGTRRGCLILIVIPLLLLAATLLLTWLWGPNPFS